MPQYNLPSGTIPPEVLAGQVREYMSVHTTYKAWLTYYFIQELNISYWARARTGMDQDGNAWFPLSKKTIEQKSRIEAGTHKLKNDPAFQTKFKEHKVGNQRYVGTLSPTQRVVYERSYKANRKKLSDRKAKEKAWEAVERYKESNPIAKLINIRTGNLVRATAPGRVSNNRYYPSPNQVVIYRGVSDVTIKIDIDYAERVDQGDPASQLPARPIISEDVTAWIRHAHSQALLLAEKEYLNIVKSKLTYVEWRAFLKSRRADIPF